MKVINDGKVNITTITLFRRKLELDFNVTNPCSSRLSDRCYLIIRLWKYNKKHKGYIDLKYKKQIILFSLK